MGGKSSTQSMLNAAWSTRLTRTKAARSSAGGKGSAMTIVIPNEVLTVLVGFGLVGGVALAVTFLLR